VIAYSMLSLEVVGEFYATGGEEGVRSDRPKYSKSSNFDARRNKKE
jgi:hypothetical protein